jgi:hypothetical protein
MPDQGDPTGADRDGDRDELLAFVCGLRALLREIVEDGRLIPEVRDGDVQRAWEQVQDNFTQLIGELRGLNATSSAWESLDSRQLSGAGLRLKLRRFWGRVFNFGRRMNLPWVRSAFRWANTILGSLAAVFPPAGEIKEFKESLENLIEDSEADAARGKRR